MRKLWIASSLALLVTLMGCSTTGHFRVPPGSQLYVYERPQPMDVAADGTVKTKPFFWTAAGIPPNSGIPYRLVENGRTVEQGHLRARFRPASIFWPPFALIYWPMGFNSDITYDLVNHTQK